MSAFKNALMVSAIFFVGAPALAQTFKEPYRPQFHYTPATNWMNDPNGLIFVNGNFQLFYQYNPVGNVAANQAWGHAIGNDLLHWSELPVAIPAIQNAGGQYTDLIYSGSAVEDASNTSGLGTAGHRPHPPLVAVYANNYEIDQTLGNGTQVVAGQQGVSIAYSLDDELSFTQYQGNPVIATPPAPYADQASAFRDPKVFWYAPERKWVMVATLSNIHKLILFSSQNLKSWKFMSTFGPYNAVNGAWECPDLFPLRVGGVGPEKWVILIGTNPGANYAGSGTQYFVGTFDGTTFTADQDSVHSTAPVPGAVTYQDFSSGQSYADLGWNTSGAFTGASPAVETIPGAVTTHILDTYLGGDASEGTLTSPVFTISKPYIDFQIGGGYYPYNPQTYKTLADNETAINLLVDGQVVQSTTGNGLGALAWKNWNVSGYIGRKAQIQVVDANDGSASTGFGHIFVDDILFSDVPQLEANWVDYGPDFYAAVTYNGLPEALRVEVGWMNNWNYGQVIPTSPWRGQMAIPRQLGLTEINGHFVLVQNPVADLPLLWGLPLDIGVPDTALTSTTSTAAVNNATGSQLDISVDFIPGTAQTFGVHVRTGSNGDQTTVGYSPATRSLSVDREQSGDVSFNPGFTGIYNAPLEPDGDGHVRFRVLVDASSVEVFGSGGRPSLTALIYPAGTSVGVDAFSTGGTAILHAVKILPVHSIH